VKRAFYAEIDDDAHVFSIPHHWISSGDLPNLPSHGKVSIFGPNILRSLLSGEPVVVEHIPSDTEISLYAYRFQALGIGSMVIVPLLRSGRLRATFNVVDSEARSWSREDIAVAADVAERTWAAVERARAEEALRTSNRLKDEFLAMLAHELRNPLAPIAAAADLLLLNNLDEAKTKATSAIIKRQTTHMTGLIDDLLDVSRVTQGLITLEPEQLHVHSLVDAAVEQVRPMLEERGHQLHLDYCAEVPIIKGDRKRLIQVLANLLNNAAKYTPNGGQIRVSIERTVDRVCITVADNGVGMGPELVRYVFQLFTQGERNPDRMEGGLGIGLALVKNLVELHEGTVTAHSDGLGLGSRFSVSLPHASTGGALQSDASKISSPAATPLKILLVDDNVDAAMMLAMLVEAAGHDVIVEYRSLAALERAPILQPDACLFDIGLPDLDGNELVRRLRALPGMEASVFIAITGYGQPADRQNSIAAGFHHYFVKPVDGERLLALLADVHVSNRKTSTAPTAHSME
jgi:signal transduction histidine kinase/ActR/RegA family two-component response regulator